MKVKVCGLREPDNILALSKLPIDMMGFIFYKDSPRFVGDSGLSKWLEANLEALGSISRVGVFVNAAIEDVLNNVHDYQLDFVQLHGDESAEYCQEIQSYWDISSMRRARLIKAFPIDEDFDFTKEALPYASSCSLYLFDTKSANYGGSGKRFDWNLLQKYEGHIPFLLSGGIDENAVEEIRALSLNQLYGVDINSKFETSPGVKDVAKVEQFVKQLKAV